MTSISKNLYIHTLDDIVNKHNNTHHRIIKMKLVDVKSSTYIDFNKENNKEMSKFKVGDHARISKYKNIFTKNYVPKRSEEVFMITKVKKTVRWICVINDPNGKKIVMLIT